MGVTSVKNRAADIVTPLCIPGSTYETLPPASTYTWSLYEVTIDGNWIDDGLRGDIDGLGGDIRRGRLMSSY